MNIGSVLTTAARSEPKRVAILHGDLRRSYGELDARANRLASALRRAGLRAGDRVALLQRNGPGLLESLFAIFKAGLTAVPINARAHPKEFSYIVADASARAVIFTEDFSAGLEAVRAELSDLTIPVCVGHVPQW